MLQNLCKADNLWIIFCVHDYQTVDGEYSSYEDIHGVNHVGGRLRKNTFCKIGTPKVFLGRPDWAGDLRLLISVWVVESSYTSSVQSCPGIFGHNKSICD